MHLLAALALLVSPPPAGATGIVVGEPNAVEVCSVATGGCRTLSAAALDPTLRPATGHVAFVDAETGALTQPTREQLEDLEGPLAVFEESRVEAAVETFRLANGTVVAGPRGGFTVELRAVLPETAADVAAAALPATPATLAPVAAAADCGHGATADTAPIAETRP